MPRQDKDEKYKASSGFCDLSCLRGLLIAFNFLFILGGCGALAIGIWTVITKMEYVALLGSIYYNLIVYLLIVAGVLILLTGVLGCVGAVQKNAGMLTCYFVLLAVIFLTELIVGVLAFVYHDSIEAELAGDLTANLNKNYNQTGQDSLTAAVDEMQQNFHCCGVNKYSDWKQSKFVKQNKNDLKTPESCCKTRSPLCSQRDHPSNIYRVLGDKDLGCLSKLEEYLKDHIFILAITGTIVACIEILVMIFAWCLRSAIRNEEDEPY
ncbi:CD151 antigen-like [Clavelina lepadiformis]|uniref:CD151 antigen-like n=1 Tax=Clavelina lepadiformis TaxID=159417 RepID=UPI004042ABD9